MSGKYGKLLLAFIKYNSFISREVAVFGYLENEEIAMYSSFYLMDMIWFQIATKKRNAWVQKSNKKKEGNWFDEATKLNDMLCDNLKRMQWCREMDGILILFELTLGRVISDVL